MKFQANIPFTLTKMFYEKLGERFNDVPEKKRKSKKDILQK